MSVGNPYQKNPYQNPETMRQADIWDRVNPGHPHLNPYRGPVVTPLDARGPVPTPESFGLPPSNIPGSEIPIQETIQARPLFNMPTGAETNAVPRNGGGVLSRIGWKGVALGIAVLWLLKRG